MGFNRGLRQNQAGFSEGFLKPPNSIPSHDTINRVFSGLRTKLFEKMFIEWVGGLKNSSIKKEVISIDGKSIRAQKTASTHKEYNNRRINWHFY